MLFHSLEFMLFFPAVFLLYYNIPHRFRWVLLLISSYIFYMAWNPAFVLLIMGSTLVDYFVSLKMGTSESQKQRKGWLLSSLGINLGLLGYFKYSGFLTTAFQSIKETLSGTTDSSLLEQTWEQTVAQDIFLPLGISFYTFQTLCYTIDVYRRKRPAEKHLGRFALYVCFFPQLVAGPIERSTNLLPQFSKVVTFDADRAASGLRLMAWGFFKKLVIADQISVLVDTVYNSPHDFEGPALILATILFGFQIFCDFSAYSDIAIGAARTLGITLMKNFDRPYQSKSVAEFWRRWHISLSTWFKDYLYIPLGGNRKGVSRHLINLMLVFVVSGIWHGANWTFVAWGFLHGLYLILEVLSSPLRQKVNAFLGMDQLPALQKAFRLSFTFLLVQFTWIFFRANSMSDALYIVQNLGTGTGEFLSYLLEDIIKYSNLNALTVMLKKMGVQMLHLQIGFLSIVFLEAVHFLHSRKPITDSLQETPSWFRYSVYILFCSSIFLLGNFGNKEFIYFQF